MGIPDNVNLGRKGKFGQVNLNGFQGGLKKTDIKSAEIKSIFDKFDINKDGTLSQDEIQELVNSLGGFAQDGKISRREAKKILKQNGLKGEVNKKAVFNFLNTIENFTKGLATPQDVVNQSPQMPEGVVPETVIPETIVPQADLPDTVTPETVTPQETVSDEPTMQEILAQKFGANGKTSALIDGTSTGLGKNYTGQIWLPKGQTIEDGKFPKTLRMSLPASYGANAAMTLTLIDGEKGIYETSAHDRHFQVTVDENGNVNVKSVDVEQLQGKLNANLETYARIEADKITGGSQDGKAQVRTGKSVTDENIIYQIDSDGNVKYINKQTGKELTADEAKAFVQTESKAITDKLTKAADYFWGTDIPLMQEGVGDIYSKDILQNVNEQLKAKGFGELKDDGKVVGMPLENLLLDEESHGLVLGHLQTLINNGVMTPQEAARSIKREMEHEVEGGLGITRSDKVITVMNLVPDKTTRLELENQFRADESHKELKENEGSLVRAYLAADGWKPDEVDRFDSYWVQNKVYDESVPEDLEHAKGVVGRLLFEHDTDSDFENQIRAGQALDPESKVYAYVKERAAEENKKAGYGAQFKGQDAVQQYIAGKTADGGKADSERIAAFNNGLYKGEKPINIQAQEVLYDVKSGDFTHVFDSMDPKLYAEIDKMIKGGEVDGVKSMDELYQKALSASDNKMSVQANALLSGTIKMSDEELTDFCINLMHNIDKERGTGGSTASSASHTNTADFNTTQLKAILQVNPQILAGLKEKVNNGYFKYTEVYGLGQNAQNVTTDTKADYLKMIADTRYEADKAVFYDNNGKQVTDPRVIKYITENNMKSLDLLREYVAQLERDHKMEVDKQGSLSGMANALSEYSGLGTDRSDVATRYKDAKQLLARMEIAAQGKLRDADGNVVSLQDLAQEAVDKENELVKTNSDYVSTIQTGKMAIVMAPVIVATMGVGEVAGAVGAGVVAGLATYGMNALEYNTSQTGNTASARENNAIESLIAGTTTFIGVKQMPFIGKMLNNASTVLRASGRLSTVLASDVGVGAAGEYVQTGQVTVKGVAMNAVFSATGNLIGLKSLTKKADLPPHVSADGTPHSMDYKGEVNNHRDFVADGEVAKNIDQSHLNANQKKMVEAALEDIPTETEVEAFRRSLGEAPTPEQQAAIEANNAKAAQANAEAHQIGNNLSDDAIAQLEALKNGSQASPKPSEAVITPEMKQLQGDITGFQKQIRDLESKIKGLKKMGKSTEALETQLGAKKLKLEEAQAKLEKLQAAETPAVKPADETPVPPKADETPAAPKADETPVASKADTPEIIEPKANEVKAVINDIDVAMPPALKGNWGNCKNKINSLMNEMKNFSGDIKALGAKCKAIFAEIDTLAGKVSNGIKVKLNKIKQNIKEMFNSVKSSKSVKDTPATPKVETLAPFVDLGYPKLSTKNGTQVLTKGQKYQVDLAKNQNTQIAMGFGVTQLDINDKLFMSKFNALKDGESFTVGSWEGHADYKLGSMQTGVSREHFTVLKENGQMVIIDKKSTNGTKVWENNHKQVSIDDIKKYFNNNNGQINGKLYGVNTKVIDLLDDVDYQNIQKLMNVCDGKYVNVWLGTCGTDGVRNIEKLAVLEKVLRQTNSVDTYLKLGKNEWDLVCNTTCQKYENAVNALGNYKRNSNPMNLYLSGLKDPKAMAAFEQKYGTYVDKAVLNNQINELTNLLDIQRINKKVKLYRGDSYDGVNYIKTSNGEPLGQAMERLIAQKASPSEIKKFVAKNLQGKSILQERFMSTTLTEDVATKWALNDPVGNKINPNGAIRWDISAPAGTKGAHCEDFSPYPFAENEVLLQRNTSLDIIDAYFDDKVNIWVIKAMARQ